MNIALGLKRVGIFWSMFVTDFRLHFVAAAAWGMVVVVVVVVVGMEVVVLAMVVGVVVGSDRGD